MNNSEKIKEVFTVLRDEGIKSFEDLSRLDLSHEKLISAQKYPWISELAVILNSMYYATEHHITDLGGQFFLVDEMEKDCAADLMKYSCLFPERMIVSAGEFHYLDNPNYSFIDIDFFRKLFLGKDLLLNNIVHISPFYLCTDLEQGSGDIKNAMLEYLTLPAENKKKVAFLDRAGTSEDRTHPIIQSAFVSLPWLKGARIQDYVEIITKYKAEFLNYNNYLSRLSQDSEDTDQFISNYKRDYNEATISIRMALEQKKAELKRKGINTVLSICLTIIPILFPPSTIVNKEILSAILGGGTIKSAMDMIPEALSLKDINKDNPFWVLWKWHGRSK